jgi:hypothetical protein
MLKGQAVKRLGKKAKKGFRGYPMATIAFYGPDNKRASKAAVAVISTAEAEPDEPRRWFSDDSDVRTDPLIISEILAFVAENGVLSVVMTLNHPLIFLTMKSMLYCSMGNTPLPP